MPETVANTATKAAKTKKPKVAAAHPAYSSMVSAAISALKERTGSSRQAIFKYIAANYKIDEKKAMKQIKTALKRGVINGDLKQMKGTGASGSFKVAVKESKKKAPKKVKTPEKKVSTLKKAAKKSPSKKTTTKKPTKKSTTPKKAATKKATTPKKDTKVKKPKSAEKKTKSPKKTPTKKPAPKKIKTKKTTPKKSKK